MHLVLMLVIISNVQELQHFIDTAVVLQSTLLYILKSSDATLGSCKLLH